MGKLSYGLRITELAAEDPDRVAVVCDSESLTREELERRANRLAREFVARGVGPGRLVTIGLPVPGPLPLAPLFDRMPTYRTQGKRSLNFLSAAHTLAGGEGE